MCKIQQFFKSEINNNFSVKMMRWVYVKKISNQKPPHTHNVTKKNGPPILNYNINWPYVRSDCFGSSSGLLPLFDGLNWICCATLSQVREFLGQLFFTDLIILYILQVRLLHSLLFKYRKLNKVIIIIIRLVARLSKGKNCTFS